MPYDLQTSNFRQPFFFLTVCKNQEQKYRTVCKNLAGNPLHVHTCVHMCTMYVLTRHYSTSGLVCTCARCMSSHVTTVPPESPAYPFVLRNIEAAFGMFFSNNFHPSDGAMRAFWFCWPRTSRPDFN